MQGKQLIAKMHHTIIIQYGLQAPQLKIIYKYFATQTYVVGTQKNRLNETVLLSTPGRSL